MVVIIGAGISGLACAACMVGDVTVLEAQARIGGYCKTTKSSGFVWDRSGHFFHFRDPDVKSFFDSEIDAERMVRVDKKTGIYLRGIGVIDFPFQKNIHQLPKEDYIGCLVDLYRAQKKQNGYSTFKEFVYATMGNRISDLFLIPYNQKLYACDLDDLDCGAMGRFFPKASFEDVLLNADNNDNSSYNDSFSYPINGAEEFVNVLNSYAVKNGTNIKLNTRVESIDATAKKIYLNDDSHLEYSVLINTSPLDSFCTMIGQEVSASQLTANKVAVFNLGFDKASRHDFHWQYFPGDEIFYRVGSYCNILGSDRESLYVEIGLARGQDFDEASMINQVLLDLSSVGIIDSNMSLVDHEFLVMDPAYVHINDASERLKSGYVKSLEMQDVYSIGRYGNWTYCSIEDNILEAWRLVNQIVTSSSLEELSCLDTFNKGGI